MVTIYRVRNKTYVPTGLNNRAWLGNVQNFDYDIRYTKRKIRFILLS